MNRMIGGPLAAMLALSACASTLREQIYRADAAPVQVASFA